MDTGLDQRVVVVTGASRGIGRSIAAAFAREGARVAVTYRSDRERAEQVAAAILDTGGDAFPVFLDLASDDSIHAAVAAVTERWGRLDVLVNNAVQWARHRISQAPPFEQVPADEWREALRINLEGAYAAMQAALPPMRAQRWGRIVNMSAVIADDGMRGAAWYAAAKSALHGLTRTLARELGADGILVNAVMPGPTLTERAIESVPASVLDAYAQAAAVGRLLTPDEVASTVVFLGSAANAAVTGQIVRASGGFTTPHRSQVAAAVPVAVPDPVTSAA
jgi:3-oxoacyl-[acyl-carrier protein] reductase